MWILDIVWHKDGLPPLVGPFETQVEAEDWARRNVPNGRTGVRSLAHPYLRSKVIVED